MTPEQRRERALKAINSRWARPLAREEQREAATQALRRRFEEQVDPAGELSSDRRAELAEYALKAHMAGMRLARARRRGGAA